jgi:hypothetical protein
MKVILKIIMIFTISLYSHTLLSQHIEKSNVLTHLTIVDSNICIVLDSIVENEKKCEYYNEKLIFVFDIKKSKDEYHLTIESVNDSNIIQGLEPYGYFYFDNHLVIIDGDICKKIFSSTKRTRKFRYIEYDLSYQEDDKKVIYYFNDDSYSNWHYLYTNGNLIFKNKFTTCR